MAKNKKKVNKYYAIKVGRGVKDKIVHTWEECKSITHGFNSVYKSFLTQVEAEAYLSTVDVAKVREQTTFVIEKKKKVRATTTLVQARVPKESYAEFEKKCKEYHWEIGEALIKLIEEWID